MASLGGGGGGGLWGAAGGGGGGGGGDTSRGAGAGGASTSSGGGGGAQGRSRVAYAFIGRGAVALCEYMPAGSSAAVGGGGTSLSKTGAQVRQRLREDGSYDFDVGSGRRAYARVRGGACFGAIALGGARPATVRQLLQDASEGFFVRYSASASPAEAVGFAAELGRMVEATNRKLDAGMSKVDAVRSQIEEVKGTMVENIDKVLARGERLDDVMLKSDNMRSSAETFRLQGRKLRRAMCCQNLRIKLLVLGLLLVLGFVIFLAVCRGFSCVTSSD